MRRRARLLTILFILAPALGFGCASDDESGAAPKSSTTGATDVGSVAPTSTTEISATDAGPSYVDAIGTKHPVFAGDQTVVDVGFLALDMLDVGIDVAAAAYPDSVIPLTAADLDDDLAAKFSVLQPVLSPTFEIDIEAIAALKPTVIVTTTDYQIAFESSMDELAQIAPMLVLDGSLNWKERATQLGLAFGRTSEAEVAVARTQQALDNLRAELVEAGKEGNSVSILRLGATEVGGNFEAYVLPSFASTIVADLGLTQPAAQMAASIEGMPGSVSRIPVSFENIPEHDADLIVDLEVNGQTDPTVVTSNLLWQGLTAVENGAVITAPYLLWTAPTGPSVRVIVADLSAGLLQ